MEKIRQVWCEEDNRYYPEIKIENGRTYKLDEENSYISNSSTSA